jgi:tetratricopeptide (TPR) repeat protein
LPGALRWNPNNARAYRLIGASYVAEGQWLLAAEAYSQAVERQPGNPALHWEWARACDAAGQRMWPELWPGGPDVPAGPALRPAASAPCGTDPSSWRTRLVDEWRAASVAAEDWLAQGDDALEAGDPAPALNAYQRALWLAPGRPAAWIKMGSAWEAAGQPARALDAYASALQADGLSAKEEAEAHARRGGVLAQQEQWAEAAEELSMAAELDPEKASYHADLGWTLYKAGGDVAEAVAHLEQALDLSSRDVVAWLRLADIHRQEGELDVAADVALRATEAVPTSPWPWLSLAQTRRRQDRWQEAVAACEEAIALRPDEAAFHLERARNLEELGQLEGARAAYEEVLRLQPGHAEARRRLDALAP